MKLKLHLEDHVSLVKFDAPSGSIDLFLLPGAPATLANELREKLNNWTGRRWFVMLSKTEVRKRSAPPAGREKPPSWRVSRTTRAVSPVAASP